MLTALLIVLGAVVVYLLWRRFVYLHNLPPPAPGCLPVLGHLLAVDGEYYNDQITSWSKKVGPIFRVAMGPGVGNVVVTGYDLIKEVLLTEGDTFHWRPESLLFSWDLGRSGEHYGIEDSSGERWKEQRHFALGVLREFGMGKASMEDRIRLQVDKLINWIDDDLSLGKRKFNLNQPLQFCIASVIANIIMGLDYSKGDKNYDKLADTLMKLFKLQMSDSIEFVNSFPALRHLPGDYFNWKAFNKCGRVLTDYLTEVVEKHIETFGENRQPEDFIDAYLAEMKRREQSGDIGYFSKEQLVATVGDMWIAGQETTLATMNWAILLLIHNPKVQQRLFEEIRDVVGLNRYPTLADRASMPYTHACINEIQRRSNVADFTLDHTCAKEAKLGGYRIPAGATIQPAIFCVHMNREYFPEPKKFDPTRFLEPDGKTLKKVEHLMPFGMGKRVCLGESLARAEIFLMLTTLVQLYRFGVDVERPPPSLRPVRSMSLIPAPYEVIVTRRR